MDKITIQAETRHAAFTELYRSSGLEIGDDWTETNQPVYSVSARRGGALLGAATISRRFGRMLLDYLAVQPEERGRGLGKMLTEHCVDYAGKAGEKIFLTVIRKGV